MENVTGFRRGEEEEVKGESRTHLLFSPHWENIWSQLGNENWAKLVSLVWSRKCGVCDTSPSGAWAQGQLDVCGEPEATYLELFEGHHELHLFQNIFLHLTFPLWSLLQERSGLKKTLFQYKYVLWEKQFLLFINGFNGPFTQYAYLEYQLHTRHGVSHWASSAISCDPCPQEPRAGEHQKTEQGTWMQS